MNRWLILAVGGVLAVVAGTVYFSLVQGLPVQTAKVRRGSIREYIDERATTRLPDTHLVTVPFAGRIEAIPLLEGQPVARGQVVARMSPRDLEEEVAAARAAVERIEAAIVENEDASVETTTQQQARLLAESMVSAVSAAEAKLKADKGRLEYAETYLGRVQVLAESGSQSEDDLEKARLASIESEVAYRQDALSLETLKAVQAATELLPRIVQQYITRKTLTSGVLGKQKQEAQARLRQALLRRERGSMVSPVDGVVLQRPITNEQYLQAGTVLMEIGELDRLEVETDILSEDVVRIREGFPAEIYGPAIGADVGQGVAATVHRIFPTGFTKISSLGVEQQRVTVVVRFAAGEAARLRREQELGVDYRVRVRIFTADRDATLVVPRSAVFRGPNREWSVYAVRGSLAVLQPVQVGLMNDDAVEVTSGVDEKETVVLAPESRLQDGDRVDAAMRQTPREPVPPTDRKRQQ